MNNKRNLLAKRNHSTIWTSAVVAIAFGIAGVLTLLSSHAATPTVAIQPEAGSLTGSATVLNDSSASGGSAVRLGSTSPSGQSMPVGDITGWHQIFADDFTTDAALGSFASVYGSRWSDYGDPSYDTAGQAGAPSRYSTSKTVSVSNGLLNINAHYDSATGLFYSDALLPSSGGSYINQTYGRYDVRFRVVNPLQGYKTAWLLWPQSNVWSDGEIDFPEGNLNGDFYGYSHCVGSPSTNCYTAVTNMTYASWHTATIEWTPGSVRFLIDGQDLGAATTAVPSTPMHYVLQNESCFGGSSSNTSTCPTDHTNSSDIQIDWFTEYSYAP